MVPEDGQSSYDVDPEGETYRIADQQEAEAAGTPGFVPPPLGWIEEAVTDESVRTIMLTQLTPHPLTAFAQPIRLSNPDAARVAHAYVHCMITSAPEPAYLARIRADLTWRYAEIPFDHLAPVTAPRETAEALLALV